MRILKTSAEHLYSFTVGNGKVSNLHSDTRWDIIATHAVERDKSGASV